MTNKKKYLDDIFLGLILVISTFAGAYAALELYNWLR